MQLRTYAVLKNLLALNLPKESSLGTFKTKVMATKNHNHLSFPKDTHSSSENRNQVKVVIELRRLARACQ